MVSFSFYLHIHLVASPRTFLNAKLGNTGNNKTLHLTDTCSRKLKEFQDPQGYCDTKKFRHNIMYMFRKKLRKKRLRNRIYCVSNIYSFSETYTNFCN